jgi:hypothetical protein
MYTPPKIPPFDPTQQLHRVPTEGRDKEDTDVCMCGIDPYT